MFIFKKLSKITIYVLFVIVIIFFSTLHAKNLDKFSKANDIANYISGVILLNNNKYQKSYGYFKKLTGLERSHATYSLKYLYSLVNSGKINLAYNYSKKLNNEQLDSFESDLVIGIYYLINSKFDLANKSFLRAKKRNSGITINEYVADSLLIFSNLDNISFEKASLSLSQLDTRFENLNKIQKVFLNCYFNLSQTEEVFEDLISEQKTDFSRYNYFYALFLKEKGKKRKASKIINDSVKLYPRNLLLNQYKIDLPNFSNKSNFNCKKKEHIAAEILYITANALSSQSAYALSNFYLNLAKFLNKNFYAFDTLLAENFYKTNDLSNAKITYAKLGDNGSVFKWFSKKQISRILIEEEKKDESVKLIMKAFKDLPTKGIYETFDYAEFLKNNEKFNDSIIYYNDILEKINEKHPLYPEATDGRGVAFERIGEWDKAEKDLLASLKVNPQQAYVINYLAYSWIEKGVKIEKSLKMLEKANKLKSGDPYIIDSLGWALFKLKRFKESKKYLQQALRLLPADPIVNDHYGDVLWKNGKEIQARYYWRYVLGLEKADEELKAKIEKKLIMGL